MKLSLIYEESTRSGASKEREFRQLRIHDIFTFVGKPNIYWKKISSGLCRECVDGAVNLRVRKYSKVVREYGRNMTDQRPDHKLDQEELFAERDSA